MDTVFEPAPQQWLPKRRLSGSKTSKVGWTTEAKGRVGPGLEWPDGVERKGKATMQAMGRVLYKEWPCCASLHLPPALG